MEVNNPFLDQYLTYVEDTESPRVFHIWAAISGAGACLGRRCFLPFGTGEVFPNNYTILVGPPGVRKSTAINIVQKLLKRSSQIRFAPTDTGGQRQGLIKAMLGEDAEEANRKNAEERDIIKNLLENNGDMEDLNKIQVNISDRHAMFVCASELATFIGINALDFITFLTKMWDGEDYDYKIKNEYLPLDDPLLSILGGATPQVIAQGLPAVAMGGGFMSRNIFVFANKKHKHIAFPPSPDRVLELELIEVFKRITQECSGDFTITGPARSLLTELYNYNVKITDPRFVHYMERRFAHLLKTCMAFAAMRVSMVIETGDVHFAQKMLCEAEKNMPDALGEFGYSPLSAAKQKLLEFLEYAHPAPVSLNIISAIMKRDMKPVDIANSLADLQNGGKIKRITTNVGDAYVAMKKVDEIREMITGQIEELV